MKQVNLTDKKIIESYFRTQPELNIFGLGDLDDFYWPDTTWYGVIEKDTLEAVALLYQGQGTPTLIALSDHPPTMKALLSSITPTLPRKFEAHLSQGLENAFRKTHWLVTLGLHYKMALTDGSLIQDVDCPEVICLADSDLDDTRRLYAKSYPDNCFDPRLFATNQYFGIRRGDALVSIAGVHVYSEVYRVAALGNITTHPAHQHRGLGKKVTARLCQSLSETVDHIGLNVKTDNSIAISLYEKLGFEVIGTYGAYIIERH